MPTNTYFGDVLTTGNTTAQQNVTVQGAYAYFNSNLGSKTDQVASIGGATPWQSVYLTGANVTTTNVTTIPGQIGIGTSTGIGATLQVQGNVYSTNAITVPNVFATNQNVTTLNTLAIFGQSNVGIGTAASLRSVLHVEGNAYVSNAVITTNITATGTTNTTTLNTLAIFGQSNVGVGTSTNLGAQLQVQGNVYISNALVTTNIVASGNILYGEDLTNRYPHLLPTPANSAFIQNWISATCNAASQPSDGWWVTAPVAVFGNVVSGPKGSNDYCGGVMLPDGRVLFVPSSASNVGIFNPADRTFTAVSPVGLSSGANKYRGGVLAPNGNVIFVPFQTNNVGVYNPVTSVFSNIGPYNVVTNGFEGGVLARNGKVILVPRESANIGIFDHTALTMSNLAIQGTNQTGFIGGVLLPNGNVALIPANSRNVGMLAADQSSFSNVGPFFTTGSSKFIGGTLAPNGNVIMTPGFLTSANVAIFNPTNSTCSNVQTGVAGGSGAFQGAALLPSGNVIFAPCAASNIGTFDPVALTYSNLTVGGLGTAANKFYGATLIPDGKVVFTPMAVQNVCTLGTFAQAPPEFCLSPYFNKF